MKSFFLHSLLVLSFYSLRVCSTSLRAEFPPRGWNSYDSFSWIISEHEFLHSADVVSRRLLPVGYEYVVVDFLWYRKRIPNSPFDARGLDSIDEWGRPIPDPDRWPSSKTKTGFAHVAGKVHDAGLKFGIHVMRGLSRQAFDANTPILNPETGTVFEDDGIIWRAQDIGLEEKPCSWMRNGFMSINTKLPAGRAFIRSLYEQYASWGVDFVKHDCVFGQDYDVDEIALVSEVLGNLNRTIVYSVSPGTGATPSLARNVNGIVNMYRITGDDWDKWADVASHFDTASGFSGMIGADGLRGKSWPDLDMLPFGWLTDPYSRDGPHRYSDLSRTEQLTQMTLWAMARSPLMFGGDMRKLDDDTCSIITNPYVLEINSYSSNNKEFKNFKSEKVALLSRFINELRFQYTEDGTLARKNLGSGFRSWIASGRAGEIYVAFFNLKEKPARLSARVSDIMRAMGIKRAPTCLCREIWTEKDYGFVSRVSEVVDVHGCSLFVLNCTS